MLKAYKIIILTLLFLRLTGQADTIYISEQIIISAPSVRNSSIGSLNRQCTLEESVANIHSNLPELLFYSDNIYIRSYGPGTLATNSIRGGSASQSLVLWNGLPLQNPMIAQLDLSTISLGAFQSVEVTRGGQSSLWGSGAISGIMQLESRLQKDNALESESAFSIGSIGQRSVIQRLSFNHGNISSSSLFQRRTSQNDYAIESGNSHGKLKNARQEFNNFHQDLEIQLSDRTLLGFHYWMTNADRQIPPQINQTSSSANQEDRIHRLSTQIKHTGDKSLLKTSLGYFDEKINYSDPPTGIDSRLQFASLLADISYELSPAWTERILIGMTHQYHSVKSNENYNKAVKENRTALFAAIMYSTGKFELLGSLRQEFIDGSAPGLIPQLAFDYNASKKVSIRAKISRNFRYPGLNDRYWVPGGNPDLLPESGWSMELGMQSDFNDALSASAGVYSRMIQDWILWSRDGTTAFWSAFNIAEVWSRGFEFSVDYGVKLGQTTLKANLSYDYILSSPQQDIELPKIKAGEQLWYTPRNSLALSLAASFSTFNIGYSHRLTGSVRAFNGEIERFHVGRIKAMHSIQGACTLFISINNIWNANYFIVENRPMPGRSFQVGVTYNFYKTKIK